MDIGCIGAPFEVKFAGGEAMPGCFEGYGAVFGNMDSYGDVIEKGAFVSTLTERKATGRSLPSMYMMHGKMNGASPVPIGVWDHMEEDSKGLYVKGRIAAMDTETGKYNYGLLRDGALRGLSIGFRVPPNGSRKGSGKPGEPVRYIKTINLREVSLVDDPANVLAHVTEFKSLYYGEKFADEIKTVRDFEGFLRDVGGFSHSAAKSISNSGFKSRPDPRDEDGIGDYLRERMSRLASVLKP